MGEAATLASRNDRLADWRRARLAVRPLVNISPAMDDPGHAEGEGAERSSIGHRI